MIWLDSAMRFTLIALLLYLAYIDLRSFLIPNRFTYPIIAIGLIFNSLSPFPLTDMYSAWMGALLGFGLLFLVNWLYKRIRLIDGLGMGDAKLLSGLGAWFGIEACIFILMLASIIGLIGGFLWLKYQKLPKNHPFPFGPFLSIAGIIQILWSSPLFHFAI